MKNQSSQHTYHWQLCKNNDVGRLPVFPQLRAKPQDESCPSWPEGDDLYARNQSARRPRRFLDRTLWDSQRKALSWMLKAEEGIGWKDWEADIFDVPAFDIQLTVEATSDLTVRGGIIADAVGAGKTTTSLALVARSLEERTQSGSNTIQVQSKKIVSKASLFLVPKNIVGQWEEEIKKCFGSSRIKVVTVKLKHDLSKIRELSEADIVLAPWDLFNEDEFWTTVGNICCAPFTPKTAGRGFQQWLDEALSDLEDIVDYCGADINLENFLGYREEQEMSKREKYAKFEVFQKKNAEAKVKSKVKQAAEKLTPGSNYPEALSEDETGANDEFEKLFKWKPHNSVPALLYFFRFERLVVDEFTYLDARSLLAIQKLQAGRRWMLSGTPPLANAESIDAMSLLLGTRISSKSEANYGFSFKDARLVSPNDKTYAEEFREYAERKSMTWLRKQHERCEQFVDSLIIQNPAPTAVTEKIEHCVVSFQSALEACIYDKTYLCIMGQSLRFGVKGTSVQSKAAMTNEEGHKFRQTIEKTNSPEEALLCCQALFLQQHLKDYNGMTDEAICIQLTQKCEKQLNNLLVEIHHLLQEAFWYWHEGPAKIDGEHANPHFMTFLYCIVNETMGDPAVSGVLNRLVSHARSSSRKPEKYLTSKKVDAAAKDKDTVETVDATDQHKLDRRRSELQARATTLNDKCLLLVEHTHQLRLLRTIKAIVTDASDLQCASCLNKRSSSCMTLLGNCGHLVCDQCLNDGSNGANEIGDCVVDGCTASSRDCRSPARFYTCAKGSSTPAFGTKIDSLLRTIASIKPAERILIFLQFDCHKEELIRAFQNGNIDFLDGTKNESNIKKFQKTASNSPRILLLKIDSADSAGWNLQMANHVMFFSPFLSKTQYDYEATMTQAIGRAYRFGQRKDVHVYKFITARTMDVNITQERENSKLVMLDENDYELVDVQSERAIGQEDLSGPALDSVTRSVSDEGQMEG